MFGVLAWCDAEDPLEALGQVTLTAKPDLGRYLSQRFARFDQPLRVTDSHTFQIGIGRHTDFGAKGPQ